MATLCPICGYENPQEEFEVCPQCGFDFNNGMNLYDKPLEGIKKASELLTKNKEISSEDANNIYNEIVADSSKVISVAKSHFEQSVNEIMTKFQMDAQYDPATAQEYIKPYNDIFMQAADTVNKGLESIGKALTSSNPENIQEMQMQLDLGTTLIEQGFFAMQNLSISVGGNDDGEYPIDITEVSEMLDYSSAYIGSYLNTKNMQELKAGLHYLTLAQQYLEEQITEYENIEKSPTDLKEELSYGNSNDVEDEEFYEEEDEEPVEEKKVEEVKQPEEIPQEHVQESVDSFESVEPVPENEENKVNEENHNE